MKRNDVFSLIVTLTALENLFNVPLLLAGTLFIISVTGHHHLSPILCLPSPAVITHPRPSPAVPLTIVNTCPAVFVNTCRLHPHPAVLTHTRPYQPSPAVIPHSLPSPAVPLIFVDICPAVIPITCSLCPTTAVLTFTLPSSDAPYSPPHNPGRPPISPAVCLNCSCHMCLNIPRKA